MSIHLIGVCILKYSSTTGLVVVYGTTFVKALGCTLEITKKLFREMGKDFLEVEYKEETICQFLCSLLILGR